MSSIVVSNLHAGQKRKAPAILAHHKTKKSRFQVAPRTNPLKSLTIGLVKTYNRLQAQFSSQDNYESFESVKHTYSHLELISTEGKNSKVYKAVDPATGKPVAIKVLHCKFPERQASKEAYLLKLLTHVPHALRLITPLKDALVTEIIEAPNLYHRIIHLKFDDIISIGQQAFEFLAGLHNKEIVQADLKPENMIYKFSSKHLTVIDMGLSNFSKNNPQWPLQSASFRAPETRLGQEHLTGAIDVWSMGCILYELYTGQLLFNTSMQTSEKDMDLALLHQVEFQLGKLPLKLLQTSKRTHEYYIRESRCSYVLKPNPLPSPSAMPWKINMLAVALLKEESIPQLTLLFDLIENCLLFENRITAQEALAHPLFEGQVHCKIVLPDIEMGSKTLNIADHTMEKVITIALSSRLDCVHLPPSTSKKYYVLLCEQKKVLATLFTYIHPHDRLLIDHNDERGWSIVNASDLRGIPPGSIPVPCAQGLNGKS